MLESKESNFNVNESENILGLLNQIFPYNFIFKKNGQLEQNKIIVKLGDNKSSIVILLPSGEDLKINSIELAENTTIYNDLKNKLSSTYRKLDESSFDSPFRDIQLFILRLLSSHPGCPEDLKKSSGFIVAFNDFLDHLPHASSNLQQSLDKLNDLKVDELDIDSLTGVEIESTKVIEKLRLDSSDFEARTEVKEKDSDLIKFIKLHKRLSKYGNEYASAIEEEISTELKDGNEIARENVATGVLSKFIKGEYKEVYQKLEKVLIGYNRLNQLIEVEKEKQIESEALKALEALKKEIESRLVLDVDKLQTLFPIKKSKQLTENEEVLEGHSADEKNAEELVAGRPTEEGVKSSEEIIGEFKFIDQPIGQKDYEEIKIDEENIINVINKIGDFYERIDIRYNKKVKEWNDQEVKKYFKELRKGGLNSSDDNICQAIAVMERANQLATREKVTDPHTQEEKLIEGHRLRDTQKLAILNFMRTKENKGHISQINTGEGKTTIVAFVQALKVMQGHKGHIITSNEVLAEDGVKSKKSFYDLLGISVSHNNHDSKYIKGPKECYNADIVYGSISNFQFDWLRHDFEKLDTLHGVNFDETWVMMDEIDSLLIDQGGNIAKLSDPFPGMESLRYVYINIWAKLQEAENEVETETIKILRKKAEELNIEERRVIEELRKIAGEVKECSEEGLVTQENKTQNIEFEQTALFRKLILLANDNQDIKKGLEQLEHLKGRSHKEYTDLQDVLQQGFLQKIKDKIKSNQRLIPEKVIAKHLHKYANASLDRWIEYAFAAKYQYKEDVEYKIIKDKEGEDVIIPVDNANTGVSMKNTILSQGLHQFLQIKHNLHLTYESLTSCYISNLDYISKYEHRLLGVTGTLGSESERELLGESFNLNFSILPTYKLKLFLLYSGEVLADEQFIKGVATSALAQVIDKRATLIVCSSIDDANTIKEEIGREAKAAGIVTAVKLYTDETEAKVAEKTLESGDIIIATNIGGRGTDFRTSPALEEQGGLHVIVSFLPSNKRVEEQALGRTSRQGKSGSGQLLIIASEAQALGMVKIEKHDSNTFSDVLSSKEIKIHNVEEDGNCFFRAVEHQLKLLNNGIDTLSHEELRSLAISYISEERTTFENYVEGDIDSYINLMSNDGLWADHPLILALARMLKIKIVIIQDARPDQPITINDDSIDAINTIYLGHITELHYVSLTKLDGKIINTINEVQKEKKEIPIFLENKESKICNDIGALITKEVEEDEVEIDEEVLYFDTILKRRDMLESQRIADLRENKIKELKFKDNLFKEFCKLYGDLKDKYIKEGGNEDPRWLYVLKDLKEKWAFWLEDQHYTADKIRDLIKDKVAKDLDNVIEIEFSKFKKEATEIESGKIKHNPFYGICLAERYLEIGEIEEARQELQNALEISDNSELLYSARMKLFEIEIESGGQILERYKKAVADTLLPCPGIVTKNENYVTNSLNQIRKAKEAILIEFSHLHELMYGEPYNETVVKLTEAKETKETEDKKTKKSVLSSVTSTSGVPASSMDYWYTSRDMGKLGNQLMKEKFGDANIAKQFHGGLTEDLIPTYLEGLELEADKPIFICYNIGGITIGAESARENGLHWVSMLLVKDSRDKSIKLLYKDSMGCYEANRATLKASTARVKVKFQEEFNKNRSEEKKEEEGRFQFIVHSSIEQEDVVSCGPMTVNNLGIMAEECNKARGVHGLIDNFNNITFTKQEQVRSIREEHYKILTIKEQVNYFIKHLQGRYHILNVLYNYINNLVKDLEVKKESIDSNYGLIIGAKVPRYLGKLGAEHEKQLQNSITKCEVDEFEYIGMSSIIGLQKVHDVNESVILLAKSQISSGISLLPLACLCPPVGAAAGALISEGITDIATELINQGHQEFDWKAYWKNKAISYSITVATILITAGAGLIAKHTQIFHKAINTCRNLANKLRTVEGPFTKACNSIANQLDKLANYLEKVVVSANKAVEADKLMSAAYNKASDLHGVNQIKGSRIHLRHVQQLESLQQLSRITTISHGQKIVQIAKSASMSAIKGVMVSIAVERIITASLTEIMKGLQPKLYEEVKSLVEMEINNNKAKLNKLSKQAIQELMERLLETNIVEDVVEVAEQISLGILRHSGGWKMQLAALLIDSAITGAKITDCAKGVTEKFLKELDKGNENYIHQDSDIKEIIEQLSRYISEVMYIKIVSMTSKVATTLPRIAYTGYKYYQAKKASNVYISQMERRIKEANAAGQAAKGVTCAHDAVAETLGINREQLTKSSGIAPSISGATAEDIMHMYHGIGIETESYENVEATQKILVDSGGRHAILCLSPVNGSDKTKGHAVALRCNAGELTVKDGSNWYPLKEYLDTNHGYKVSQCIIPKGITQEARADGSLIKTINHYQIQRKLDLLRPVGMGIGVRFGGTGEGLNSETKSNFLNVALPTVLEKGDKRKIKFLEVDYTIKKHSNKKIYKQKIKELRCMLNSAGGREGTIIIIETHESGTVRTEMRASDLYILGVDDIRDRDNKKTIRVGINDGVNARYESGDIPIIPLAKFRDCSDQDILHSQAVAWAEAARFSSINHGHTSPADLVAGLRFGMTRGTAQELREFFTNWKKLSNHLTPNINRTFRVEISSEVPKKAGIISKIKFRETALEYWLNYQETTLEQLLKLRLQSTDIAMYQHTSIIGTKLIDLKSHQSIILQRQLLSLQDELRMCIANKNNQNLLVPILIPQSKYIYHWVGLALMRQGNNLELVYLDSENLPIAPELKWFLITQLPKVLLELKVSFRQQFVEQQKYNNCGLELIENFVQLVTGQRTTQENVPYLHSELWVQKLIMEDISQRKKIANTNDNRQLSWSDKVMKQREHSENQGKSI